MRLDFDIDTSEVEAALAKGRQKYAADVVTAVRNACREGAKVALEQHIYENRTGDLSSEINGEKVIITANGAEGEIVADTKYASYVNEWEESKVGTGFMDKAAEKAEQVLNEGLERATQNFESIVNE